MLKIVTKKSDWKKIFNILLDKSILCSFEYLSAAQELEVSGKAQLAIFQEGKNLVAHPYILRKIKGTKFFDIVSVYDFGGFWFNCASLNEKKNLLEKFEKHFSIYCNEKKIITEFIRLYPFFDYNLLKDTNYTLEHHKDNVIIELSSREFDEIYNNFSPKRKNKILQAKNKNNLSIVKENEINKFIEIYYNNLDRLSASQFFYFSKTFFEKTIDFYDIFYIYNNKGNLCAGHIYLKDFDKYFVYLTAGIQGKFNLRPNCFAYYNSIKNAHDKKFNFFHFGGGGESLYHYKKSFSKQTLPYFTCKKIYDINIYNKLVCKSKGQLKTNLLDNFFPEYRRFEIPFKPKEMSELNE